MNTSRDRSDDAGPPPSDDLQAAEYVLGLLDAQSHGDAQARLPRDAVFAQHVQDWEQRLAPWLLRATPTEPSAHVWPRLRRRLGWEAVETPSRRRLWDHAPFWRGIAGLATAAGIAALALGLIRLPTTEVPTAEESAARPVTVLAREGGATGWIARIDPARGKVLMVPVPAAADPSGRVNELWIIPAGGAPQSLGYLSHEKAHTIDVPPALLSALASGATLAVTLEDQAGIPHAAPNGPIVAKGSIGAI